MWFVWFEWFVPVWEMLCGVAVCNLRRKLNWGTCPGKDIRLWWALGGEGRLDTASSSRFGTAGCQATGQAKQCRLPITDSSDSVNLDVGLARAWPSCGRPGVVFRRNCDQGSREWCRCADCADTCPVPHHIKFNIVRRGRQTGRVTACAISKCPTRPPRRECGVRGDRCGRRDASDGSDGPGGFDDRWLSGGGE